MSNIAIHENLTVQLLISPNNQIISRISENVFFPSCVKCIRHGKKESFFIIK